jgi:UDP-2-acetamido-2-deoxy-ribo-hexuluronate aminotransferase
VHYPVPIHRQPAYADPGTAECCPVAVHMAARVISLPMGPYLDANAARQVATTVLCAVGSTQPASAETMLAQP